VYFDIIPFKPKIVSVLNDPITHTTFGHFSASAALFCALKTLPHAERRFLFCGSLIWLWFVHRLLEGVFHFMQKPNELLNNQIDYYHGIGDFNEEFIEQLHQETKKFRKRMGHLSDYQKQINAMVVLDRLENLEKVKEAQEKVATESKRKLARYINGEESLSEERRNAKRKKQHEDRLNLLVRLGSTDGFGPSVPTNHQRHVADHV